MQEVEARLKKGENIEDILDSWEDEATKAFWAARGEKSKPVAATPPPTSPEDEEFVDDYAKPTEPIKPLKLTS